jgi:PTH1 family peptidyl-tRNA hydrolase
VDQIAAFLHITLRKRCFRLYRQASAVFPAGNASTFVEPLTFMNNSGAIAPYFLPKPFAVEDLIVVCDNMDLPPGMIRVRRGGSSAGHKGLTSLIDSIGSDSFIRIYVGIGHPVPPVSVVDYVLSEAQGEERVALDLGIEQAVQAVLALCDGKPLEEVMRAHNRKNNGH